MKAMLTAFVAIAVIAVAANWVLNHQGFSGAARYSGEAVRLK